MSPVINTARRVEADLVDRESTSVAHGQVHI
jgi:hypothetical protein